ncbi:hypothetical protein NDU88_009242 [Pleurodeles waltl]|uniref:Uncharacterized protein n=1 Tax=Pleurodeles waltl TaxID=8319 RepID=A0AAV7QUR1_PLEWA|nr:hypothetical protein NDU88_009242 [Pleurodeles waltl]
MAPRPDSSGIRVNAPAHQFTIGLGRASLIRGGPIRQGPASRQAHRSHVVPPWALSQARRFLLSTPRLTVHAQCSPLPGGTPDHQAQPSNQGRQSSLTDTASAAAGAPALRQASLRSGPQFAPGSRAARPAPLGLSSPPRTLDKGGERARPLAAWASVNRGGVRASALPTPPPPPVAPRRLLHPPMGPGQGGGGHLKFRLRSRRLLCNDVQPQGRAHADSPHSNSAAAGPRPGHRQCPQECSPQAPLTPSTLTQVSASFRAWTAPGTAQDRGWNSGPSGAAELGVRHLQPLGHAP